MSLKTIGLALAGIGVAVVSSIISSAVEKDHQETNKRELQEYIDQKLAEKNSVNIDDESQD